MASFDSLPPDQKAVLSMVLQHGRSFDEIAAMLGLDRARVRQRALEGFDLMGPDTGVDPLKRSLITDYLVGQLPAGVADSVRTSLAENPQERAWARVIAAEIAPLAVHGLPEIPAAATAAVESGSAGAGAGAEVRSDAPLGTPAGATVRSDAVPRSSRRGGAILLGLIAIVVIAVVVVLIATGGSSKKASPASTTAQSGSGTGTSGTSTGVTPLHEIDLASPNGSKTVQGVADVVKADGKLGLVIAAQGLPPTTSGQNAYAVWLENSQTGAKTRLGFYTSGVSATGRTKGDLEAEVPLSTADAKYNQLLLTLETKTSTPPGTIVLQGAFAE